MKHHLEKQNHLIPSVLIKSLDFIKMMFITPGGLISLKGSCLLKVARYPSYWCFELEIYIR